MTEACAFCSAPEPASLYELPFCLQASPGSEFCTHSRNGSTISVTLDDSIPPPADNHTRSTTVSHPKSGGCEISNIYDGQQLNFFITTDGLQVRISWSGDIQWRDIRTVLAGLPAAYLLRKRGILPLHASGVSRNDSTIAFVGKSGSGKSTLAAHFITREWSVVADDLMALQPCNNHWRIQQGPVALKLYDTAAKHASLSPSQSERLWGSGELDDDPRKLFRQVPNKTPTQLDALFVLDERGATTEQPTIQRLKQREAHYQLAQQIFAPQVIDESMLSFDFSHLGMLVRTVPVYKISRPDDIARIGKTIDLIEQQLSAKPNPLAYKQST